ncbi:hypothetical protein HAX54_031109, partial [Datura stramonium]|nr:hypothetical protein [Datura stramonium]
MEEYGSAFNKGIEQSDGQNIEVGEGIGEDTLNGEEPFTTTVATTFAATRVSFTTTFVIISSTTAYVITLKLHISRSITQTLLIKNPSKIGVNPT